MKYSNKFSTGSSCRSSLVLLPVLVICFIISSFTAPLVQAQETSKTTETKPVVQLSHEQLKAFEGVFQNPRNNEMYVQFTAKENTLNGKLLWNNNEVKLTPESETGFVSSEGGEDGPIHIRFVRDSTGAITKVSVGNNELWTKVNNYKPIVKTEMVHTPEQLKPFEGLYKLQNNRPRFIQMKVKENSLVLRQHWDGNEVTLVPQSELDFFSRELPLFSATFTKAPDGTVTQALTFKRDKWDKIKKIQLNTEQLKVFEGKYQFRDDPDNFIQITAKGKNLVVKQLWDGKETVLEPQTENYFYNNNESYPLLAIRDKNDAVIQVQILDVDLFNKVK